MDRPVPRPTALSEPFWKGLDAGKILIQYSPSTDKWVFYPRPLAPGTLADDLEWREVAGSGTVYTFTIARRATAPAWSDAVPQIIAVVEVAEGARIPTELVNVAPDAVTVGMQVRAVFDRSTDGGVTLLKFEPV
jgi:uncharacterized OB-fold protein